MKSEEGDREKRKHPVQRNDRRRCEGQEREREEAHAPLSESARKSEQR